MGGREVWLDQLAGAVSEIQEKVAELTPENYGSTKPSLH
jgi:hypothetical protein